MRVFHYHLGFGQSIVAMCTLSETGSSEALLLHVTDSSFSSRSPGVYNNFHIHFLDFPAVLQYSNTGYRLFTKCVPQQSGIIMLFIPFNILKYVCRIRAGSWNKHFSISPLWLHIFFDPQKNKRTKYTVVKVTFLKRLQHVSTECRCTVSFVL